MSCILYLDRWMWFGGIRPHIGCNPLSAARLFGGTPLGTTDRTVSTIPSILQIGDIHFSVIFYATVVLLETSLASCLSVFQRQSVASHRGRSVVQGLKRCVFKSSILATMIPEAGGACSSRKAILSTELWLKARSKWIPG